MGGLPQIFVLHFLVQTVPPERYCKQDRRIHQATIFEEVLTAIVPGATVSERLLCMCTTLPFYCLRDGREVKSHVFDATL